MQNIDNLLNAANAALMSKEYKKAMQLYNEVLVIYDENLEPEDMRYFSLYINMAALFEEIEDYISASGCYNKAIILLRDQDIDLMCLAVALTKLGMCLLSADEYGEAIETLNEALAMYDNSESCVYQTQDEICMYRQMTLLSLAEVHHIVNEYNTAVTFYKRALEEIKNSDGIKSYLFETTFSNFIKSFNLLMEEQDKNLTYKEILLNEIIKLDWEMLKEADSNLDYETFEKAQKDQYAEWSEYMIVSKIDELFSSSSLK